MDPLLIFVRMAQFARRRPSRQFAYAALGALVLAGLCVAFEAVWGWPESLTLPRRAFGPNAVRINEVPVPPPH